ncbi:MAG TPA: glucokinase [Candidatus Methylomirabilis sp.]
MILAGDIGGTNTRLAFFKAAGGGLRPVVEETLPSREQESLEAAVSRFVSAHRLPVEGAGFGVPGPVVRGRCEATNLPWVVDARRLARHLGIPGVSLLNDLEANAYGIPELSPGDLVPVHPGAPDAVGNAAVIAAGTGLGEAGLFWDGTRHHPFACEGGHTSFSPTDGTQVRLLQYLLERYEHISWERVLSGPGLHNIYLFLRDTGGGGEPPWLRDELGRGDPAAVISRAALEGRSALCARALDLLVALYGSEAGNLALKCMATGGVFVGGGIAPKILPKLQEPGFREAFLAKGRMRRLLEGIPVRVIVNDKTALLGAAHRAALGAGVPAASEGRNLTARGR